MASAIMELKRFFELSTTLHRHSQNNPLVEKTTRDRLARLGENSRFPPIRFAVHRALGQSPGDLTGTN